MPFNNLQVSLSLLLIRIQFLTITTSFVESCMYYSTITTAFVTTKKYHPRTTKSKYYSTPDYEEGPSDYDPQDVLIPQFSSQASTQQFSCEDENDFIIREELKRELLLLSSITNRGQYLSPSSSSSSNREDVEEYKIINDIITQLEALNPTPDPAYNCIGEWDLCLCSTNQLFRSSLLFQSIRALFGNDLLSTNNYYVANTNTNKDSSMNNNMIENIFNIYDKTTTPFQKLKRIKQSIKEDGIITNEIDVELSTLLPFPTSMTGTLVSIGSYEVISSELWKVKIGKTLMKNVNLPSVSGLGIFGKNGSYNGMEVTVPVDTIYESIRGSVPVVTMKTYYVDETMRITRDQDNNFYVFCRA